MIQTIFKNLKILENTHFCLCDKTALESNFPVSYYFLVCYIMLNSQQNRIDIWFLDTLSKDLVILAFSDKNQHTFFDT